MIKTPVVYPLLQSKLRQYSGGRTVMVPRLFWCGQYMDGGTVIPDGHVCCFNHWVSLPTRWRDENNEAVRHPLYPYQEKLIKILDSGKRSVFVMKPPKIGMTELALRYALHRALIDPAWRNGQVAMVAFTGGGEAKRMIGRARDIMLDAETREPLFPFHKSDNESEFHMNTVRFRAFPAANSHINSIRSQPNMRMIILDEAAFPSAVDQDKIRDAAEHYILGSEAAVLVITTAGDSPSGFAYDILNEQNSRYEKLIVPYQEGLKKHPQSGTCLYDEKELAEARKLRSFAKNYQMQWGYGTGDIFDSDSITACSAEQYDLKSDLDREYAVLAIDPAYGKVRTKVSSKYGILGMYKDRQSGLMYTNTLEELETPSDEQALKAVQRILDSYNYHILLVDGQWTGIINTFRPRLRTIGFRFGDVGLKMTDHAGQAVADRKVRIHPSHDTLIQQLRAIKRNDRGMPDKTQARFDVGDCFLMCTWFFKSVQRRIAEPGVAPREAPRTAVGGFGYGTGNLGALG